VRLVVDEQRIAVIAAARRLRFPGEIADVLGTAAG